jgi:ABC-type branched-subunit amino acid transport system ATPase component|tara:strand:+ start:376 stop:519 length:144 start_codon:yes stop_codon:yes gene_type:complete
MIKIPNLSKAFCSVKVVNGLSLMANDGRITSLIDPNGSGKTTAFRAI